MCVCMCGCCRSYILFEREGRKARDAVANFHTQNGAAVERLNALADTSPHGMAQSYGVMVNYVYNLAAVASASAACVDIPPRVCVCVCVCVCCSRRWTNAFPNSSPLD